MAKIRSFGAELYINGVAVGGITDIQASGTDVSFVDTTSHDTAGGFKTFLSGLKDGGTLEVTGKYNFADAGQAEWKAEEGISHDLYIMLSDNSGFAFRAIIGGFQTSNPLDDAVEFTATAKITGEVFPVFPTIIVTGTLTPDATGTLYYSGMTGGAPQYTSNGLLHADNSGNVAFKSVRQIAANYYQFGSYNASGVTQYVASSTTNTAMTPDRTTYLVGVTGTGNPTLTGS